VIMDRWRKTTAVFVSSEKLFVSRPWKLVQTTGLLKTQEVQNGILV
jgi:hypothetical protein